MPKIPSLSNSIRLFKEGLDRKLFWTYWGEFRDKWWEIFWGPTVLGIVFGLYTIWYAPGRKWFLAYVLIVTFLTGYYLWRVNHLRLVPKFKLMSLHTISTPTNDPRLERMFGQLLVGCETEGTVEKCQGQLRSVMKWSAHKQDWEPTQIDELVDLLWSNVDEPTITLESGADRRLNLFFVQSDWKIVPRVGSVPLRVILPCAPGDMFKFDVRVSAPDCPPKFKNIKVSIGQKWNDVSLQET